MRNYQIRQSLHACLQVKLPNRVPVSLALCPGSRKEIPQTLPESLKLDSSEPASPLGTSDGFRTPSEDLDGNEHTYKPTALGPPPVKEVWFPGSHSDM